MGSHGADLPAGESSSLDGAGEAPVLITGGNGFIGHAIAKQLLREGRSVVCLDVSAARRSDLGPGCEYVQGDVRDAALVERWVRACGTVIHLAAVVGVDEYLRRASEVLDVSILGARNVLESCLQHDRAVVLASTSEVYGKNDDDLREDAVAVYGPPSVGRWCYAVAKAASEHYAFALGARGLRFSVVRYFNVYGPTVDEPGRGRVVSKFLGSLRDGRPLALVDGGAAIRSYCYGDDAAAATIGIARSVERGGGARGRAINVGRGEPVTVRELAERMIALSGHAHGVVSVDGASFFGGGFDEIPRRVPDLSALRETTGFVAGTSLDAGLRLTLAHWGLLRRPDATPPPDPMVPMVRPSFAPDRGLLATLGATLRSGHVTNDGPLARQFERGAADFLGVPDAAAVSSGASALLLAVHALGLRGRVVLPSFTYIATLAALTHRGIEPIFCDVDPATWTMDPGHLAAILQEERGVTAVLPVNVYGVAPDLTAIADLAARHGALVVYDNAHGFGSERLGRRHAPEVAVETFSFHATKALPAVEGGLVVTSDARLLGEVRRLAHQGRAADPYASSPGYNARIDELRAAVGLHGLRTFEEVLARRAAHAERLRAFLGERCGGEFVAQRVPAAQRSNGQNVGVRCVAARAAGVDAVVAAFARGGVEARRYFHPPLHQLEAWRGRVRLPVTEDIARDLVCLPIHSVMTEDSLRRVEAAASAVAGRPAP